jgi:hypothetical protein
MLLLYADESNLDPETVYFVYVGIAFPVESIPGLHRAIEDIRTRLNVPREYVLKFNPKPTEFTHAQFIELKQSVLEAAATHGAQLIAVLTHHGIVKDGNVDHARRLAINTILYHFDCHASRRQTMGLALLDRFPDKNIDAQLKKNMAIGLTGMPYSAEYKLKNVVGVHFSAIGQAHFPSIVDVAAGSLRFAIDTHVNKSDGYMNTAKKLLSLLRPMFLMDLANGTIHKIALMHSPTEIKAEKYTLAVRELFAFLSENGLPPSQKF